MSQRDALACVLRRFDGGDDGRSPVVTVSQSGHQARGQTSENRSTTRPETINLTDSLEAVGVDNATAVVGAANGKEDGIPMLEYSASDLQRIDNSVEESQQGANNV